MEDVVTGWAHAAAAGDRLAAAAFVRATQVDVTRFLTHLVGARDAEDLAQETYLRAFRSLPGFAGRSTARTWLYSIARRVAADHVRTARRRPRVAEGQDWLAAAERRQSVDGGRIDEQIVLRRLLDALPVEQREAFVATQLVGLSYEDAAQVCGCPVGTIRSRVARARGRLLHLLGDTYVPDDGKDSASA